MKKTISSTVLVLLVVAVLTSTIGVAWLSDRGLSSPIDITSNLRKSYFQSGDGSKVTPYEIATPVQLYYFSWLQYLGYFNEVGENNQVKTFYFTVSHDLDMTGYTLPPIGTKDQPFLGNFDGGGKIISNLTIENRYNSLIDPPANTNGDNFGGVEIIGFFGVIGALEGDVSYSYATLENQVKDLILENITVKTQTDTALIGLVAGYVNGTVDCVGVVNATVDIKSGTKATTLTANLSDYALIGYCDPSCASTMYTINVDLSDPSISDVYQVVPPVGGDGDKNDWGGSIKMYDIYTWLSALKTSNSASSTTNGYVYQRTDLIDLNGKIESISTSKENKRIATVENFGSFVFNPNNYVNYVNFVSGAQMVTEYKFVYTKESATLFYITDGTHYLSFNGTSLINEDKENATAWYISNDAEGGIITTVYNGRVYYLNISNSNLTITAVDTADAITNYKSGNLPKWTISDGNLTLNSQKLEYSGSAWKVASNNTTSNKYLISSANQPGNYLIPNDDRDGVTNTTDENVAKEYPWTITGNGNSRTISVTINNQTYYLGRSGENLLLKTSSTTWTRDSNNAFYIREGNRNYYYLSFNNEWKAIKNSTAQYRTLTLTEWVEERYYAKLSESPETEAKKITVEGGTPKIDNSTENVYYDENGNKVVVGAGITYFPLSAEVNVATNTYKISTNNTGYIVGAEWDDDTSSRDAQDTDSSNLRISVYTGTSEKMENASAPYTISYKTHNQFTKIESRDAATLKGLGLVKYADCYQDYYASIKTDCYGLHFMDAPILKSNVTEITAYLNGKDPIDNYQLPTNCIDFNLYEKGFINAFAGTYYMQNSGSGRGTVNDSFFSLYQIFRDPDDERKIIDIKEIYGIYAKLNDSGDIDTSKDYYYTFIEYEVVNGVKEAVISGEDDIPDDYQLVFDSGWLTNPTGLALNSAYYFEVPVNAGEYAFGSTSGKTGAYIVYLDLAANAQIVERTRVDEKIVTEECASTIPKGVSILEKNPDGYNTPDIQSKYSTFVSIGADWSGSAMFSQTGNVVTDSAIDGHTAVFIGHGLELKNGNDVPMAVPITPKVTTVNRSTYYDVNLVTEEKTVTVIQTITVNEAGQTKVSYTKQVTVTDADGQVTVGEEETFEDQVFPDVPDPTTDPPTEPEGSPLLQMQYVVSVKDAFAPDFYYERETTEGESTIAPTYTITFQNKTGEDMPVRMELTSAGRSSKIVFTVKDGTKDIVLDKEQSGVQNITVKKEEAVSS